MQVLIYIKLELEGGGGANSLLGYNSLKSLLRKFVWKYWFYVFLRLKSSTAMKCFITNLTSTVKQSDQNLTKFDYLNAWTFFPFIYLF